MLADLKKGEKLVYENVGHLPQEEIPEQSVKDAEEFFNHVSPK